MTELGEKLRGGNEKDILIEGAIVGLGRNQGLGKFPGSTRITPAKTLSNSGEGTWTDLPL